MGESRAEQAAAQRGRRGLLGGGGAGRWPAFPPPLATASPAGAATGNSAAGTGNAPRCRATCAELLGDELSPDAAQRLTRQWFRFASCKAIDVMRLRYRARPLRRLVEIRGREHLEAALAGGKGAILCSAHFGSFDCAFSLLGASGFPVTTIGRWQHNYTAGLSSAERRFWDLVYARRLRRHRHRPNIEPWAGRVGGRGAGGGRPARQ